MQQNKGVWFDSFGSTQDRFAHHLLNYDGVLFFLNANFAQLIHFYIYAVRGVSHLDDKTLDDRNLRCFVLRSKTAGADVYKKQHKS